MLNLLMSKIFFIISKNIAIFFLIYSPNKLIAPLIQGVRINISNL